MKNPLEHHDTRALRIRPGHPLRGEISSANACALPGDKSLSHRAALFAAMADGPSCIQNFLVSGVTSAMLEALTVLEVSWELAGSTLKVEGLGLSHPLRSGGKTPEDLRIYCGNSATTLRLLAGALAAWGLPATLDGSTGLRRRPMRRIVEPLQQMGVAIDSSDGCAPLILQPSVLPLHGLNYTLLVASAQVKSCLLLAALAAGGVSTLVEPGPSRDHTERMLRAMGVTVITKAITDSRTGNTAYVTRLTPPRSHSLLPLSLTLPGDISAAAFLIVAALITPGSRIILRGVGLNPTRTGLLDALQSMGADIQVTHQPAQGDEPVGDLLVGYSHLHGIALGGDLVVRMIDEFPAFAAAAAYATGTTVVSDAAELRTKESDRISDLCQELGSLGVDLSETPDGFVIRGGSPLHSNVVNPHGDHRLAMALAVVALAAQEQVDVQDARIIHESFPNFAAVFQSLGADITLT